MQSDAAGPRRVLFIDEGTSFGGALVVTSHLVRYLDPERYRAVVAAEAGAGILQSLFEDRATCYAMRRAFNYTHSERVRPRVRKLPFRWLRTGVGWVVTAIAALLNTPYYLKLAWIVRKERIDLIHHSNGATRLFLTLLGRPYVATLAGIKSAPYARLEKAAMKRMSKFVMISRVALDAYLQKGGRAEIAVLVPNPCDPRQLTANERAAIRERYGIGPHERVFGIMGRIVHWKGQKEFVRAAVRVLEEVPDARALLAGSAADGGDEYLAAVHAVADGSPHRDRIRFLGYVAEIHEIYNVLDVAVHASTVPEPFGLVVIEAMGYGVPIIAANSGGPREIIEEGVDGFLVEPTNATELAERIARLLKDDGLRKRMGDAGREKVERMYHARQYADRIQRLYDEVLLD